VETVKDAAELNKRRQRINSDNRQQVADAAEAARNAAEVNQMVSSFVLLSISVRPAHRTATPTTSHHWYVPHNVSIP